MVVIKQQLVPEHLQYKGSGVNAKKYLTVHETANTRIGANAKAHANLQARGYKEASWHYQGDDKEVIQSYPNEAICWHAGDGFYGVGNTGSIGFEICVNEDGDFPKAVTLAIEAIAQIMVKEGIPLSNLVQHNYWSGKDCPKTLRVDGYWPRFVDRVKSEMVKLSTKPAPSSLKPKTVLNVDGVEGPLTIKQLQRVLNTKVIDGVISKPNSAVIVALQKFLNANVNGAHIKNLTGASSLKLDGSRGPATTKVFQFWSANRFSPELKILKGWTLTEKNFNLWVDGIWGPDTIRMEQMILNQSVVGSGRLG